MQSSACSAKKYSLSAIALAGLLMLCFSICTAGSDTSDAATSGTTGSLNWELNGSELTITGTGSMADYSANNYPSNLAPWGTSITKVTIGEGATSIGNYAFYNCTLLFSVSLPSTLKTIGNHSFEDCSTIVEMSIPDSVTTIKSSAFTNCSSLNEISLGTGLKSIESAAFNSCKSLTSISFPKNFTTLGDNAFYGCTGLGSITLPDSLTVIPQGAFRNCTSLVTLSVPDSITTIQGYAFSGCSKLTSISFGSGLQTIGERAFYDSGLVSVTIPNSVTTIESYAFSDCYSLSEARISTSLSSIGSNLFGNTYSNYLYSASVSPLSPTANLLAGSHLVKYSNSIYRYVGGYSGDTTWSIEDDTLTFSGNGATGYYGSATVLPWDNAYSKVVIGSGITEIGSYVFKTPSNVTEVVIADTLTTLHTKAFVDFSFKDYDGTTIIDATADNLKGHTFAGSAGILQLMRNGITVLYKYSDGSTASEDIYQNVAVGTPYDIASPAITGYSPSSENVTGTLEQSSEWYVVTYTPNTYSLTIKYVCNEESVTSDHISNVVFGKSYSVNSPSVNGYTTGVTIVTGTMDQEGKVISVEYTPMSYNLTIYYLFEDNTTAADTRIESVPYKSQYSFESPTIDGFTPSPATVTGTMYSTGGKSTTVYYYPPSYTLTIRCLNADGNEISAAVNHSVYYNKSYNYSSPSVTGYTATTFFVSGTMDTEGKTVDVTYNPNDYTLRITYTQAATASVFDTVEKTVKFNSAYSVDSPFLPGYAANYPVVEGTMDSLGKEINVVYTIKTFSLKVMYKYSDDSEASPTHEETVAYGSSFNVSSPTILGYVPDYNSVSGVMGMHDLEYTVVYNDTFKITIVYVYADGSVAAEPYTATVGYGSSFDVSSPTLAGYTPDRSSISGMMGSSNLDYKVTYASSSSGGSNGSSDSSSSGNGGTTTLLVGAVGIIAAISLILTALMFIRKR